MFNLITLIMSINITLKQENLKYISYINKISDLNKNDFLNYIINLGFKEYIKINNSKIDNNFLIIGIFTLIIDKYIISVPSLAIFLRAIEIVDIK